MTTRGPLLPAEAVVRAILVLRGQRVLLDQDLASLYGVETRALVQSVKRNPGRFRADFMFQLTPEEASGLRSQTVISNPRGGRGCPPHAFTEQGVAMRSSVLRTHQAIQVNVEIMRTFVKLRQALATHEDLARKLKVAMDKRHDEAFRAVFDAIRRLMDLVRRTEPPRGLSFTAAVAPLRFVRRELARCS